MVPVGISLVLSGVGSNGANEVAEEDAEEDAEDDEVEGPSAIGIKINESLNSLRSSILIEPLGLFSPSSLLLRALALVDLLILSKFLVED